MKIALASTGNTLDSIVDQRISRFSCFAIYETDTEDLKFLLNPNKESLNGAGSALVQFVACQGVQKIISGEFGGKIKPLLDELHIQMITQHEQEKRIFEILDLIKLK